MSKLCDVKNMYGQDLGISVTNATVSQLKQYDKLPKNMLIISSPNNEEGNDIGMPSLFATDYNGNYLQLTYAIESKNGLYPNKNGYLQLNIDGSTIKEKDEKLVVDTNNLTYCSFNNLGVAKVSRSISNRTNSSYPIDTFINVDKNGVLYLSDSFLEYIYKYIGNKIYENLYPLIMDNIKCWLVNQSTIKYYPSDKINILGIDESNGVIITQQYTLEYNSLSDVSEEVNIDINNNDYPIKEVIFSNNTTTVTEDVSSTNEIKMYRHSITFTIVFYPNYNLQNNIFLDNQYLIKFQPQSLESNQSLLFYFNQNNAFDKYSNEIFKPFEISSAPINLNQLRWNHQFEFSFINKYKYFEDIHYELEIKYITSDNINNTDDAITLINENINQKIQDNYDTIHVYLDPPIENKDSNYNVWKNELITVDYNTGVITKKPNISSLYKYILRYTISGERTYTYENTFNVIYELTNIYKENNYLSLSEENGVTIYSVNASTIGGLTYISGGSLNDDLYSKYLKFEKENDNTIIITPNTDVGANGYEFIYKILNSLIAKNSLTTGEDSTEYSVNAILGNYDGTGSIEKSYNNEVGFLLIFRVNYVHDIYITNGGENNNQQEYTIYNAIINIDKSPEDGKYYEQVDDINKKEIIVHYNENMKLPTHAQYHTLVYPKPDAVVGNPKTLQVLSYIKLDNFMFQNSSNREHTVNTPTLWHNFTIYNAQGPNCNIKFGFNYGKFFNSHIKIFNVNYGHHTNPFDITSTFILNPLEAMEEITSRKYSNSRFFVGINKKLIDVMKQDSFSITWYYTAHNDDGQEFTGQISVNSSSSLLHKASNSVSDKDGNEHGNVYQNQEYDIYEINYINEWYTVDNTDTVNPIKLNVQITSFKPELEISYKWKNQQDDSVSNIFKYNLGFTLDPNPLDPDIQLSDSNPMNNENNEETNEEPINP